MVDNLNDASVHNPCNIPFWDSDLPMEQRLDDLIGRMTLHEKINQLLYEAPSIERLGVPAYNWWNECLHGVGRAGLATVFPQIIGMAASWNVDLMTDVGVAISDEARAKHHQALSGNGDSAQYFGLTFWSPNINIFRDPRWGRGQETFGEDPFLTTQMAVEFIKALQGNDPKYLKISACAKHFAAHSGPEAGRNKFDSIVSEKDLWETYLPAFEACVKEADVNSVMGAYNSLNGEPCCANHRLLVEILREKWSFDGYVVSDCGAICHIFEHHKLVDSREEAAALAVNAGCDLNCGNAYSALNMAASLGLISEETINTSVRRLFAVRMRLGMFDSPQRVKYACISPEVIDSPKHRQLALESARQSMVLLKNDGLLPLKIENIRSIAVIGPNADDTEVLLGNYHGTPSFAVTPLAGLREKFAGHAEIRYAAGCPLFGGDDTGFNEAVAVAKKSDVAVVVLGLSNQLEGEEGDAFNSDAAGDRRNIVLPGHQEHLLQAVVATGTPTVLVLLNGSALAINWANDNVPAILEAWYPGQAGGTAIAETLFGDYNPAGRLPVTFYRSISQLPPLDDYSMEGRTYRYFGGDALFTFGYGLSYTSFDYSDMKTSQKSINAGQEIIVSCNVANIGEYDGDEVVQLYIKRNDCPIKSPRLELAGFKRFHIAAGQHTLVEFAIKPEQMRVVDEHGIRRWVPQKLEIFIGGGQPGFAAPFVCDTVNISNIK